MSEKNIFVKAMDVVAASFNDIVRVFSGGHEEVGMSDLERSEHMFAGMQMGTERGVSGVPNFGGRFEERYMSSLDGPEGIAKMATILRKEPSAFVANQMVLRTARETTWSVLPGGDSEEDREVAEFVESLMNDMSHSWDRFITFALSCSAFGFADVEIVPKRRLGASPPRRLPTSKHDDGRVGLRKLSPRRQETVDRWIRDKNGGIQKMIQRHPETGEDIPIEIERLLHFIGGDDRGSWQGLGWLEAAYSTWHMLENYQIIEGVGWQRTFTGLPVFRYKARPAVEDVAMVKAMGRGLAMNERQYVTIPGMVVDFDLESIKNPGAGDLREKITSLRWEIMSLVSATFVRLGGADGSGSRALSYPLIDLYTKGVDVMLDTIEDVLNRHLIPRVLRWNGIEVENYPRFTHSPITRAPLEVAEFLLDIQQFLDGADEEDYAWFRGIAGMPKKDWPGKLIDRKKIEEAAFTNNIPNDRSGSGSEGNDRGESGSSEEEESGDET